MELIGPYLAASALLVVAGAAKFARPDGSARAFAPLVHWPFGRLRVIVRVAAAAEVGIGLVAIVLPRPLTAGLVAVSYLAFAIVVLVVRSRGGSLASCGCFGTPDTPATRLHVVVDLGLAGAAVTVAAVGPTTGSITSVLAHQPWAGVPLVLASAACAWLVYLALSPLAALHGARHLAGATRGRWR